MSEKKIAAVALAFLGIFDMGGMFVLSCMERPIATIFPETMGIVIGGLVVLAGVNGIKNGLKKTNGG